MEQLSMFANEPLTERGSEHVERICTLLRKYAGEGKTLEAVSGPQYLGRSLNTLKPYCRRGHIAFPDYTPRSMRTP